MKLFLLISLLSLNLLMYPQQDTDSTLQELQGMKKDSLKVKAYLNLFWDNYRIDMEKALAYATEAEALSLELEYPEGLANSKRSKSFAYSALGDLPAAETEMLATIELYRRLGNLRMLIDSEVEFARILQLKSDIEAAIKMYLDALPKAQKIGDQNAEARIQNYLGGIYRKQKQYNKAIASYTKALSLVEALNIVPGISACLANLSGTHADKGDYEMAIFYGQRALEFKKQQGDKLGIGRVLNNLGVAYNYLEQYDEAEAKLVEANQYAKEVGDQKLLQNVTYSRAVTAYGKKDYQTAIRFADSLSTSFDTSTDLELQVKVYMRLYKAYGALGKFGKAYEYGLLWEQLSDSLYDNEKLAITNELEARYQSEERSKTIALLESEAALQELQLTKRVNERNGIILLSLIFFVLAGLLFNQYRIKQKANKQLKELDKLKSNFFANISHEFRTPLTLIQGPLEQLEQNPEEPLQLETIKMIRRNTNRLLGLVDQLLDLSKIDEGNLDLTLTEGDVFKCLRAATASFNSHAAQRNMDYRISIPQSKLWATFDRDKLEKITYNLLSNAFKFSQDGAVILFEAEYKENQLSIQVSDSGLGIAEEDLPFIFDRFYQADTTSTRLHEGSGIGLALSWDLVQLMDGTLTATSEEGKGSIFTMHLPLEEIKTGAEMDIQETVQNSQRSLKKKVFEFDSKEMGTLPLILVVEDNQDMRHFITHQLREDYRIKEATNGEQGLEMALQDPPDLIIMDVMMPKMDGMELCKHIKTTMATSHVPVIMLTAKAGLENKMQGLETGADDYLTKPFHVKELVVRIRNLISQRKQLKEVLSSKTRFALPNDASITSLDQRFLEQLHQLLEANYSIPEFGVSEIQKVLGMSNTQAYRKIKALTGETPGELIRNFRLQKAAQLLEAEADTVTQVAYRVGFNNLSYFAKCFKNRFGVSPSAFVNESH